MSVITCSTVQHITSCIYNHFISFHVAFHTCTFIAFHYIQHMPSHIFHNVLHSHTILFHVSVFSFITFHFIQFIFLNVLHSQLFQYHLISYFITFHFIQFIFSQCLAFTNVSITSHFIFLHAYSLHSISYITFSYFHNALHSHSFHIHNHFIFSIFTFHIPFHFSMFSHFIFISLLNVLTHIFITFHLSCMKIHTHIHNLIISMGKFCVMLTKQFQYINAHITHVFHIHFWNTSYTFYKNTRRGHREKIAHCSTTP